MEGCKECAQLAIVLARLEMRVEAEGKALDLARKNMEHRLEGMNEFRAALKEQQNLFVLKSEQDFIIQDLRMLRESKAKLEGKADQGSVDKATWLAFFGILMSFVNLVIYFLKH